MIRKNMKSVIFLCSVCLLCSPNSSSRILAVAPTVSSSHFAVFKPLLLSLASRGHEVVVISSFPQHSCVDNYTDISIRDFKNVYSSNVPIDVLHTVPASFVENLYILYREIADYEHIFSHPGVKKFLRSNETFDLVITEVWNSDLFLGFGHRFKAPVVVVSSSHFYPWFSARFGNPNNPSYIPNIFLHKVGKLNLWERLMNTVELAISRFAYDMFYNSLSEKISKRVFGDSLPPLSALAQNSSLVLVNTHPSVHGALPVSPQVVQIGGIHVEKPSPLPKELSDWLADSPQGVVYFSFGSIIRGSTLPAEKVKAFQQAFEKLPQRVLWKWEDSVVRGSPSNVKMMKWIPQRDVLAHPNVKVFISHGGLLGLGEAVASGVPVLGIPLFSDQPNNVAALVERGAGLLVDYNNISVTSLTWALERLTNDKSYSRNAKQLSHQFLDRPQTPLETAVYWTEYIIKHGGAHHLKSAAVNLSWNQYYLLDVVVVCVAALVAVSTVLYLGVVACVRITLQRTLFAKAKLE